MNPVRVTLIVQPITCEYKLNTVSTTHEYKLNVTETITTGGALPDYQGEYVVTPKTTSTTLETENKSMRNNVVVKKIPYSVVTNPSGGRTITIA